MSKLLIIGSQHSHFLTIAKYAQDYGSTVRHCASIDAALATIDSGVGCDLIIADVVFNIPLLIQELSNAHLPIPVIVCGDSNNAANIVEAVKAGAKEYLALPPEKTMVEAIIESIQQSHKQVIVTSSKMQHVIDLAKQIAPSKANVLITGESGTGKEVIASFIHQHSLTKNKPLISLNCAAIPENLLESELFGHEKGAFTGAISQRIGKFEEANNSTLLLDEISEMDIRLQAKLLRALQEQEIQRVGGNKPIKLNLRVIATSNRNLEEAIKEGTFREDLFFRLNVIHLQLPPLRERTDDIPAFINHFITFYSELNHLPTRTVNSEALSLLTSYSWPGNIRELENTMHRLVLLAQDNVISKQTIETATQFGSKTSQPSSGNSQDSSVDTLVGNTVEQVERDLIEKTLDHCLGNRTHAASMLGISIRTLRNKLKVYEGALVE